MMHIAWCCLEEVPYCFSRSSVIFQGHTALKIVEFDPDWAFPDCNSSLNSPMANKWCTKLEVALKRCPVVFHGHLSNFKVTEGFKMMHKAWCNLEEVPYNFSRWSIKFQGHTGEKFDDFYPIWVRLLGWSQLSNPSDLPCFLKSFKTALKIRQGYVESLHLIWVLIFALNSLAIQ